MTRTRKRDKNCEKAGSRSSQSELNGSDRSDTTDTKMMNTEKVDVRYLDILESQIHIEDRKIGFFTLFRYIKPHEVVISLVGCLASVVCGAALPLMTIVFGNMTQHFMRFVQGISTREEFQHHINQNGLYFLYLGIALGVCTFASTFIHVTIGEIQTVRVRQHYMASILHQNIAFFDFIGSGEITERITTQASLLQESISEKMGTVIEAIAQFVSAFIISFIKSWRLTLILFSAVVAILVLMGYSSVRIVKFARLALNTYAGASSIADESFSAIRSIVAFGAQDKLATMYDSRIRTSMHWAIRRGHAVALMVGLIWGIVYMTYALAFWQGSRYLASDAISVSAVITVVMSVIMGLFSLGVAAPHIQSITTGVAASAKLFSTIDREPAIRNGVSDGGCTDEIKGEIEFRHLKFIYPSRPDKIILRDFSLKIPQGSTVALVGPSGCGKSTLISILERFYEYVDGEVTINGRDLRSFNIQSLRRQLGLVLQEPLLFSCSIRENIEYGLVGSPYEFSDMAVKDKLILNALEQANASKFVFNLPKGLDTEVGERGLQLSGGQKQRIAIARAVVSRPRVLLLDEATSALDTKSEGAVQRALDKLSEDTYTTKIIVAHRLSTIRNADMIVVMEGGGIVEIGKHEELIAKEGAYFKLVQSQSMGKADTSLAKDEQLVSGDDEDKFSAGDLDDDKISCESQSIEYVAPVEQVPHRAGVRESIKFLYNFNKTERKAIFTGFLLAFIAGGSYPALSILFSKTVNAFRYSYESTSQMRKDVNLYTGFLFMLAIITLILYWTMILAMNYASSHLVRKIRLNTFKHLMRQDIEFFDRSENSVGALTAMLARDAQDVEGLGGATLAQICTSLCTIIAGIILALAVNWRMALVCTACVPILVICGFLRVFILKILADKNQKMSQSLVGASSEIISALRVVLSLTREEGFYKQYSDVLNQQFVASLPSILKSAVIYGLSQGCIPWVMGLGFWYGGTLIKSGTISIYQFFLALMAIVSGAQNAGSVFSHAPGIGKARQACINICGVFDYKPRIDAMSLDGLDVSLEYVEGTVELRDVHFRYPTRLESPVLRGINMKFEKHKSVGIVGRSGSGKSTIINLIERFYDPQKGEILLDGNNISNLNIKAYRKALALVPQEPALFSGTIRENITLGVDYEVTDDLLIKTCIQANIHDFISSLSEGYDTQCGSKGIALSGGQRQRIAIARALLRNPRVLLLDEATSALDSKSEMEVQKALEGVTKDQTTIIIAHRLSTIRNCDLIYVIENGVVAESGTHEELIKLNGIYKEMSSLQALV